MSNRRKRPTAGEAVDAYTSAYRCGHCNARYRKGPEGLTVSHQPGCPALTGAVDAGASGRRAAAAASEATGIPVIHMSHEEAVSGDRLGDFEKRDAGPRMLAMMARYDEHAAAMARCPHLPEDLAGAGGPGFWMPSDPGALRCLACFMAAQQRQTGTREESTCDHCRRFVPETPAGVPRIWQGAAAPVPGAVIAAFGFCTECAEADQAGVPL